MAIDALKQLDDRIQASVARIHQLRKENEKLTVQLAESERKLAEVNGQVKQLDTERRQHETERSDIKTRIEKILARFDELDLS
jgi:predicted nuclease with TOPRIM domain